jgi:hypothetical protein
MPAKKFNHRLSPIVLLALCLFGFKANAQQPVAKQLIGEWRNVYLKLKLNINDAKPVSMEADSSNWEARLQIKPIRTHFKADGSYYSEYRNLKDSVVRTASGTWALEADTLLMSQTKPSKSMLKLHLAINKDHAIFSGVIDFNGDGKKDDDYFGIQKKFSDIP